MSTESGQITAFKNEIDQYKAEFFGGSRKWLDELVEQFIADKARRNLIIIGEPGVGKSAYIAHLADKYQCPRYFTRARNEIEIGASGVDPKAFLISIGHQLGQKYGAAIFGEGISIRGEASIGKAMDKSSAAGIDVEEAYVSPFRRLMLEGLARAEEITGEARVAGVRVKRIYDSSLAMDPQTLLHEALIDPLSRIAELYDDETVLILIDGLDVSLQQTGTRIVDVIPSVDNLQIVITSRLGEHLARFRSEDKIALSEVGAADVDSGTNNYAANNRDDARDYITHVVYNDKEIAPAVQANVSPQQYIATLAERSDGNFLYLHHFWTALREDIKENRADFLKLEGVPKGLYDFYRTILIDRIKSGLSEERWEDVYVPVLGVLAVAQEPLTRAQISNFARVKSEKVSSVLGKTKQFLDELTGKDANTYRVYHASFIEYLLDSSKNRDYPLDGPSYHFQIASYFREGCDTWSEVDWSNIDDDYPFRHLAVHLKKAGTSEDLYSLVDKPWMNAKRAHFKSHHSFSSDVELVILAAGEETPPNVVQLVRGCLIYATLGSLATNVPASAIGALALAGEVAQAQDYAKLIQHPDRRSSAFYTVADALLKAGRTEEARDVLEQALTEAGSVKDDSSAWRDLSTLHAFTGSTDYAVMRADQADDEHQTKDRLLSVISLALARAGDMERAVLVAESIKLEPYKTLTPGGLAELLAKAGDFVEAREMALSITHEPTQAAALTAIGKAMVESGDDTGVSVAGEISDVLLRLRALAEVGLLLDVERYKETLHKFVDGNLLRINDVEDLLARALIQVDASRVLLRIGESDRAIQVAREALATANQIQDEGTRVVSLASVAPALALAGDRANAIEATRQAIEVADSITDPSERINALALLGATIIQVPAIGLASMIAKAMKGTGAERSDKAGSEAAGEANAMVEAIKKLFGGQQAVSIERTKRSALRNFAGALALGGEQEAALAVATLIGDRVKDDEALSVVAFGLAKARKLDSALSVADQINDESTRKYALGEIALAFAEVGEADRAITMAHQILAGAERIQDQYDHVRAGTLETLALTLAKKKMLDQAFSVAKAIQYDWHRIGALCGVARALVEERDLERATSAGELVLQMAQVSDPKSLDGVTLCHAVKGLAEAGLLETASKVFEKIDAKDRWYIRDGLKALIHATAQQGKQDQVSALLDQMLDVAKTDPNESNRPGETARVAQVMAEVGRREQALEIAETITEEWYGTLALLNVVDGLTRAGNLEGAKNVADRALRRARTNEKGLNQIGLLTRLALALKALSEDSKAIEVAREALAIAASLEGYRDSALKDVSKTLAQLKEFDQALETATQVSREQDQAEAFVDIGNALNEAGNRALAAETAHRALKAAGSMWSGRERSKATASAVTILVRAGDLNGMRAGLEQIRQIPDERERVGALMDVTSALIEARSFREAIELIESIPDKGDRADLLCTFAVTIYDEQPDRALRTLKDALELARLVDRRQVFGVLSQSVSLLAENDKEQTLWKVFESVIEIDGWWET